MGHLMYIISNFLQLVILIFFYNNVGSPKRGFIFTTIVTDIPLIIIYLVGSIGLKLTLGNVWFNIARNIPLILTAVFLYEGSLMRKLTMYAEEFGAVLIGAAIGNPITVMVLNVDYSQINHVNLLQIIGTMIYTDISLVIFIFAIVLHNKVNKNYNGKIRSLGLICLMIIAHLIFMCLSISDKKFVINHLTVIMHLVFQGIIIILSIAQFYSIKKSNNFLLAEEELKHLRSEIQHTYDYYMLANEKYDYVSKLRHDINNQINTVKMLISEGTGNSEVEEIIEQLQGKLSEIRTVQFCANPIINAVLTTKSNEASIDKIETDFLLKDCEELPFDNYDICSLFANLCDNAIEACHNLESSEHRFIEIKSGIKGNYFILKVRNSTIKSAVNVTDRFLKTSKNESGHGYGLKIVGSIVKKYSGEMNIQSKDGVFTIIVALKLK